MKIYYFLLFGLLIAGPAAHAQNVLQSNVTWNSTRAVEQTKGDVINYSCQFVTNADQSVDWIQRNGARVYHYIVSGVDGTWPDASTDGQLTYHVTLDSFSGDITFLRSGGQTTVHLAMSASGQAGMDYMFYIASVGGQ